MMAIRGLQLEGDHYFRRQSLGITHSLSRRRPMSRPHLAWLPQRIGIFVQLLLAFLVVALLPLTAFWQFERARSIEDGREDAHDRLTLFSDRIVQAGND